MRQKTGERPIDAPFPLYHRHESENDIMAQSPMQAARPSDSEQPIKPVPPEITYHKVIFGVTGDVIDDVWLNVNDNGFYCRPGKEVVLPSTHLAVLANARTPHYYNVPGETAMQTAEEFPRYTYSYVGPSSEAEFRRLLAEKRVMSVDQMPRVRAIELQRARLRALPNL